MSFKRIIVTGPECSGKSSLCRFLSAKFGFHSLPEYSVQYLAQIDRPYVYSDILEISKVQNLQESKALIKPKGPVLCDTSFLVLYIWSVVRFGKTDPFLLQGLEDRKSDLFLLCKPDLAWESGHFRENPDDREMLFERYLDWLLVNECEFFIVQGRGSFRERPVERFIRGITGI